MLELKIKQYSEKKKFFFKIQTHESNVKIQHLNTKLIKMKMRVGDDDYDASP